MVTFEDGKPAAFCARLAEANVADLKDYNITRLNVCCGYTFPSATDELLA
jgi:hypothetical protein